MKWKIVSFFFLFVSVCVSQTISTSIDKNQIKIGEQIQLTLKAKVQNSDAVVFPENDSLGKFEVVNSIPIAKKTIGNTTEWTKKYNVTQFDAGKYKIPALAIYINKKQIKSEEKNVEVVDVKVDTTKQKMHEIKPDEVLDIEKEIIEEVITNIHIFRALGLILLLSSLVYFLLRYKQKKNKNNEVYVSPYEKAIAEIQTLNNEQNNNKVYYSKVIEIIKKYFDKALQIPALESTTDEFVYNLKSAISHQKIEVKNNIFNQIETLFSKADLVKFAKNTVSESDIIEDKKTLEEIMIYFQKTLPKSNEQLQFELAKQEAEKQRKKQRNERQISFVLTLVLGLIFSVFYFGYDNLVAFGKEKIYGKNAEFYLRKEWIASEYGTPVIRIETPNALMRDSMENKMPFTVKSVSQFSWQKISDQLSVQLRTTKYVDSIPSNLQGIFNDEIDVLMKQGAQKTNATIKKFKSVKVLEGEKFEGAYEVKQIDEVVKMNFVTFILEDAYGLHPLEVFEAYESNAVKLPTTNGIDLPRIEH